MWFLGKFTSINWTKLSRTRIGPYKMRLTDVRMEKCVDNYWGIKANHSRKSHSTDGVFHFICFTDFSGMACILSAVRRAITNYLPTLSCPRISWTIGIAVENASATLCRSFHGHCRNYRHFCHNCATNLMVSLSTWIAYAKGKFMALWNLFPILWFCPTRWSFKQTIPIFPNLHLPSQPTIIPRINLVYMVNEEIEELWPEKRSAFVIL